MIWVYPPGTKVEIFLSSIQEYLMGTIVEVSIRHNLYPTYAICWWHNGVRYVEWLNEHEYKVIGSSVSSQQIGFRGENNGTS